MYLAPLQVQKIKKIKNHWILLLRTRHYHIIIYIHARYIYFVQIGNVYNDKILLSLSHSFPWKKSVRSTTYQKGLKSFWRDWHQLSFFCQTKSLPNQSYLLASIPSNHIYGQVNPTTPQPKLHNSSIIIISFYFRVTQKKINKKTITRSDCDLQLPKKLYRVSIPTAIIIY